jgi:hypothetical protein
MVAEIGKENLKSSINNNIDKIDQGERDIYF